MQPRPRLTSFCIALVVVGLWSLPSMAPPIQAQDSNYVFTLHPEQQALALDLLQGDAKWQELGGSAERVVFCDAQPVDDKHALPGEPARRYALTTHYVYDTGRAIRSLVDLVAGTVVKVESVSGALAGLSAEEGQLATDLAMGEPWLAQLVDQHGTDNVRFEPMLIRGDAESQRLVQMAVELPGGYVMAPLVLVDLETQTVRLEIP